MATAPADGSGRKQLWPILAFWIVTLVLFWIFSAMQNVQTPQLAVAYSTFRDQVRAGNVESVAISGDRITATLRKAIADPQANPPQPERYGVLVTTYPSTIGDRTLLPLLSQENVRLDVSPPAPAWIGELLVGLIPVVLVGGLIVWSMRAGGGSLGRFSEFGRSGAQRYRSDAKRVTFADVAAADEAKAELQEEVDFLKRPLKYHAIGARIPRGVLLVGAPGTGKTLLARAVAGEADVPFFSLNASEFVEMFVGVGASRVRDLFAQAKAAAPAIVFIDELDAVGRRRGAGIGNVNDEREQTLNQLLGELDGFDEREDVIVLAATNRPDVLDPALLRPGRFDRHITIELPDRAGREAILRVHVHGVPLDDKIDLGAIAAETAGFSGADLANLCNEAALGAARANRTVVTMADFDEAHDRLRLGTAHSALSDPQERRTVAYHEAGHALVAWFTPGSDPVHKVTILPRGQALGQTEQLPDVDRRNITASQLRTRLCVMLAGHTAEGLINGETTTGVQSDLLEATRLARRMVTSWGMGELGPVGFTDGDEQPFLGYEMAQGQREYSEATAAGIDRNVRELIAEAARAALALLNAHRAQLDTLADALMRDETADAARLQQLLGPRPPAFTEPSHELHIPV